MGDRLLVTEGLVYPVELGLDLTAEANKPQTSVCLGNHPRSLVKCMFPVSNLETLCFIEFCSSGTHQEPQTSRFALDDQEPWGGWGVVERGMGHMVSAI